MCDRTSRLHGPAPTGSPGIIRNAHALTTESCGNSAKPTCLWRRGLQVQTCAQGVDTREVGCRFVPGKPHGKSIPLNGLGYADRQCAVGPSRAGRCDDKQEQEEEISSATRNHVVPEILFRLPGWRRAVCGNKNYANGMIRTATTNGLLEEEIAELSRSECGRAPLPASAELSTS